MTIPEGHAPIEAQDMARLHPSTWEAEAKGCYLEAIRHKRAEWLVENIHGVKQARVIGRCELMQGDCLEVMPHLDRVEAVLKEFAG